MKYQTIPCGPYDTNAYVISNEKGEALIIDAPPQSFGPLMQYCSVHQLKPMACIISHAHWDHIMDAWQFQAAGIPVYAHPEGEILMTHPELMAAMLPPGLEMKACQVEQEHWLTQGPWSCGSFKGVILHTPGHCPGSICLYLAAEKLCFVGDLIFFESVGRSDFPGGDKKVLSDSILNSIFTLPDDVLLFPGHGKKTTVGYEKSHNPFIRAI